MTTKTILVTVDKPTGKAAAAVMQAEYAKSLTRAFRKAAEALNEGTEITVEIKVAAGEYDGDLGSGAYELPQFDNVDGRLHILGGYNSSFTNRDPFHTPSQIITIRERSAPIFKFAKNSKLAALVIDGLVIDTGNSNNYDAQTNSLMGHGSCTHPFFKLMYFETNLLQFSNCVFMNSPHRMMEPLIRAASDAAEIRYDNCIFLNNIIPIKLDSARFRHKPARIVVNRCSFLLNWALNPDVNTSNPAALEIGPADAAHEIQLTNNLFYTNFGGAILALNLKMPPLIVNNNNFVGNGLMHGQPYTDAVAMIVAAGGRKQPLDVDDIEDVPHVDEAEGNVSIDPGLPLAVGNVQTVDADAIQPEANWQNEVRAILGLNLDGGRVEINDFAPRQTYNAQRPPFATNPAAAAYGAAPLAEPVM